MVAHELERCGVDIAALQETRLEGNGNIREKSHTIFWSGVEPGERRTGGVALAISNKLIKSLTSMPTVTCDRIISVRIPLEGNRHATVISVYAPTMSHSDESKEEFYASLKRVTESVSLDDKLIILGDFNARVGCNRSLYGQVLGNFGKGTVNSNGDLLLNFCAQFNLVITNTIFKQPDIHFYSWMHPRSKRWHLLDYVLTRQRDKREVHNTRAMRAPECSTDHILIKSKFQLKIAPIRRRTAPGIPKKLSVKMLGKDTQTSVQITTNLRRSLAEKLTETSVPEDIDERWNTLKKINLRDSEEVLLACQPERTPTGLKSIQRRFSPC